MNAHDNTARGTTVRCLECGNRLPPGEPVCPTCRAVVAPVRPAPAPTVAAGGGAVPSPGMMSGPASLSRSPVNLSAIMTSPWHMVSNTSTVTRTSAGSRNSVQGRIIVADGMFTEHQDHDLFRILTRLLWLMLFLVGPLVLFYFLITECNRVSVVLTVVGVVLIGKWLGPTKLLALLWIFKLLNPTAKDSNPVPVRYFRVREDGTNAEIMVRMKGHLIEGNVSQDDRVVLFGRFRGGTLHVRRGHNERTSSAIRLKASYSWAGFVLTVVVIILLGCAFWEPIRGIIQRLGYLAGQP